MADVQIADLRTSGLAADRPAAADALEYYATDTKVRSRSDGVTWSDEPAKVETHVHAGSDITSGTVADARVDSALARDSEVTSAIGTHAGIATAHHTNANDPSSGEKAALAGTSGTPGSGNKYVTDADSRNTDARTPTAHNHAGTDITSGTVAAARLPTLDAITAPAADLSMNTHKITGVVDPTSNQHAATKKYVDDAVAAGVSFGTPTNTYGTPAAGSASTALRTDAVLPLPPSSLSTVVDEHAQVTMTNANQYYDGPAVTLSAGTWLLVGQIELRNVAAGIQDYTAKLWDGTTIKASGGTTLPSGAGFAGQIHLSAVVVIASGTPTWKISCRSEGAANLMVAADPVDSGANKGLVLNAIKIA